MHRCGKILWKSLCLELEIGWHKGVETYPNLVMFHYGGNVGVD